MSELMQKVAEPGSEVATGSSSPAVESPNHPPPHGTKPEEVAKLLGPGSPLPPDLQRELGQEFDSDITKVRVHADARADHAAKALGAEAFAVGNEIVFGRGRYNTNARAGRDLIAHEAAHIAAGQTTGTAATQSSIQLKVSVEDVSEEMVGMSFTVLEDQGTAPDMIPKGSVVMVIDWKKKEATARVQFTDRAKGKTITLDVPKLALEPVHPSVHGLRRYEVGLPTERTAVAGAQKGVEQQGTAVAEWKKKEPAYRKHHDVWAGSLAELESELTRREDLLKKKEAVLSDMLIRETMLDRFDPAIARWVEHYNRQFKPATDLDPNVVKSMLFQESRMGTSGEHLDLPPYSWSGGGSHPIRSRFNIGQAIDSSGAQQLLMMKEMAPALFAKYKLDELEKEIRSKGLTEGQIWGWRSGVFGAALQEFHQVDPGSKKNRMGTPGKELFEDYEFWIRTAIRWLFFKYFSLSTPDWAEAVRAYNGSGPGARKYKKEVMSRVGSSTALDVGMR